MHTKATTSKGDIGELLVIPKLKAHHAPSGNFVLTEKFLSGMGSYAERWPGKVTAMVEINSQPDSNLDHVEVKPGCYPFDVEAVPVGYVDFLNRARKAEIVMGGPLGIEGVRQVEVTEYSLHTQLQIISAEVSGFARRWKRSIRTRMADWRERHVATRLAGIQCNGIPTYNVFKQLNKNTIMFFDSRIEISDLVTEEKLTQRAAEILSGAPLRLAFTGRLKKMKGADHLPKIALELQKLGVPFRMDICGGGDCEQQIARCIQEYNLADQVHLRGVLQYREELIPLVQDNVDLFVCPHVQGDPSCTYLETMACGVPIVGYGNEAWEGMAPMSRAGWVTPVNDPRSLAAKIAELDRDRPALVEKAKAARAFAKQHLYEHTMDMRVQHLLSCREQPL